MSATHPQHSTIPSAIEHKLRRIGTWLLVNAAVRTVAWGLSVLILTMIVAMIVDWSFTLFSTNVRFLLTSTSLVSAALVTSYLGIRYYAQAIDRIDAAMRVDSNLPDFEERWTTIATYPYNNGHAMSPTSRAMLQQVTSEAIAMSELVDPRQVTRTGSLRPPLVVLAASLLLLCGFVAIDWQQTSVLLSRFWSPTSNLTATQLASLTEDQMVPRGETIELTTQVAGLSRESAELRLRYESGLEDVVDLRLDAEQRDRFFHSLRVTESFQYQVLSGDGRTDWHSITAIDAPEFEAIRFRITPPDYIDRPPYEKAWLPTRLKVAQGSRLELEMRSKQKLSRMELALTLHPEDGEAITKTLTVQPDSAGWYRFSTQLIEDMSLNPRLISLHGLKNDAALNCRIEILPDMAPIARVVSPNNEMTLASDEAIEIEFEAHDDHGIATAELVIYDESETAEGEEPKIIAIEPIDLGDQRFEKHIMASTQLDLTKYGLKEGAQIGYAIRVTDNRSVEVSEQDNNADLIASERTSEESPTGEHDLGPSSQDSRELSPEDLSEMIARNQSNSDPQTNGEQKAKESEEPQSATTQANPADDKKEVEGDAGDTAIAANNDTKEQGTNENPAGTKNPPSVADSDSDKQSVPPTDSKEAQPSAAGKEATDSEGKNVAGMTPEKPAASMKNENSTEGSPTDNSEQPLVAQRPGDESPTGENIPATATPAADDEAKNVASNTNPTDAGEQNSSDQKTPGEMSENSPPPGVKLSAQSSESGQEVETNRRKIKIAERLAAVSTTPKAEAGNPLVREKIVDLDRQLAVIHELLRRLVERQVPDSERSKAYPLLDTQLGTVESSIAAIREETKETEYAFVGLQMADIGRTHVTPARDAVFAATQSPIGADSHSTRALHHVERARELLQALLKRYDSVNQEREFKEALEEAVKMYEVYVEKRHRLMREVQQNQNPLQRKMAVLEVDQAYLDRYAEVEGLRREMMAEFARMLGDDPRLLSRYLDLVKRRRSSLRDQLRELHDRQDDLATELSSWIAIDDTQRGELWRIMVDLRLQTSENLASDLAEFAERIEKQLPLLLEGTGGTSAALIGFAGELAQASREVAIDSRALYERTDETDWTSIQSRSAKLHDLLGQIESTLDRLSFENQAEAEVIAYVDSRLVECQTVRDQSNDWARYLREFERNRYHALAQSDQHKLTIATELLRVQMLGLPADIDQEFQQQEGASVPPQVAEWITELTQVMESITHTQFAATFALRRNDLAESQIQHERTLAGFDRAEELFDQIRRGVIEALDEFDVDDPDIAQLVDPTLDRFLEQLEREPNLEAQLGIPGRPRNLRVLADTLAWQTSNGDFLQDSMQESNARAQAAMKKEQEMKKAREADENQKEPMETASNPDEMREMIEKSLKSLEEKMQDQSLTQAQRDKLKQTAQDLKQMLNQASDPKSAAELWKKITESDAAKSTLKALSRGERIPDQQWNRILSTLNEGLWQVSGRKPPEEYRKPIEQYQDRVRELLDSVDTGVEE